MYELKIFYYFLKSFINNDVIINWLNIQINFNLRTEPFSKCDNNYDYEYETGLFISIIYGKYNF